MAPKKALIEPIEIEVKKPKPRKKSPAKVAKAVVNAAPELSDEEIARTAYLLWEQRGRPIGSSEEDWYRAKEELATSGTPHSASA